MKQNLGMKKLRVCKDRPGSPENHTGSEVMSGHLILIQVFGQRTLRIPVYVKVYRNCFEHYAVVYKDQKHTNLSTYVNLKNSVVMFNENCKTEVRVVPDHFEGTVIVFDTEDKSSVSAWKFAFEDADADQSISPNLSPVIPRSPVMPTLEEALEEE